MFVFFVCSKILNGIICVIILLNNIFLFQKQAPGEDDEDLVKIIQELKQQLVIELRKNHALDRKLAKLDKRIALLIKNRFVSQKKNLLFWREHITKKQKLNYQTKQRKRSNVDVKDEKG